MSKDNNEVTGTEVTNYIDSKPEIDHNYGIDIMDQAMTELIMDEPFYANLIMNMRRQIRTDIPTAGVSVTENVNLIVNPFFWISLSLKEQVGVLKHECLHVLHDHISRFAEIEPHTHDPKKKVKDKVERMRNASTLNVAADLAINEYLPTLPRTWKMFDEHGNVLNEPDMFMDKDGNEVVNPNAGKNIECNPCLVNSMKKKFPKMENEKHMEYYYEIIKEEQDKNKDGDNSQNGGWGTTMDDHSIWSDSNTDPEYIKEKIRQTANKALEETMDRNAGNVSGDIAQLIEKLNYKAKDWRSDLHRFVARNIEIFLESSRKKRNRRYGISFPGSIVNPKLHLAVAIDTSGSVRDEELCQFIAEIDSIHKNNVQVTIVECDADVQAVYEFDPRKAVKIVGRGGTRFIPAFEEVKKKSFIQKYGQIDGLVYLTDGGNFEGDELKKPKFPVLWAVLEGYGISYDWGSKTQIKVTKKK